MVDRGLIRLEARAILRVALEELPAVMNASHRIIDLFDTDPLSDAGFVLACVNAAIASIQGACEEIGFTHDDSAEVARELLTCIIEHHASVAASNAAGTNAPGSGVES